MTDAITVTDIYKNFGAVEALKGVSLKVEEGEKVVVIGPSGSGKSVLIRCVNGLETPDRGTVVVDGMDLSDRKVNARALARDVAMVFQSYNLYPHKTVLENVTLAPIKVLKVPHEQAERDGRAYLERVGLSDKVDKYPDQLSAASSSAWPSPAPSTCIPRSCCSTSRRARSIPKWCRKCSMSSSRWPKRHDHRHGHP